MALGYGVSPQLEIPQLGQEPLRYSVKCPKQPFWSFIQFLNSWIRQKSVYEMRDREIERDGGREGEKKRRGERKGEGGREREMSST